MTVDRSAPAACASVSLENDSDSTSPLPLAVEGGDGGHNPVSAQVASQQHCEKSMYIQGASYIICPAFSSSAAALGSQNWPMSAFSSALAAPMEKGSKTASSIGVSGQMQSCAGVVGANAGDGLATKGASTVALFRSTSHIVLTVVALGDTEMRPTLSKSSVSDSSTPDGLFKRSATLYSKKVRFTTRLASGAPAAIGVATAGIGGEGDWPREGGDLVAAC
mmetsp:Transcript_19077/g.38558  ORF Transcript_19077/g.38558 Transcript_19077/m.38558 type:complete len:221 (-) Transcript_19077:31-693(-)